MLLRAPEGAVLLRYSRRGAPVDYQDIHVTLAKVVLLLGFGFTWISVPKAPPGLTAGFGRTEDVAFVRVSTVSPWEKL